jgi:hypothetical protein
MGRRQSKPTEADQGNQVTLNGQPRTAQAKTINDGPGPLTHEQKANGDVMTIGRAGKDNTPTMTPERRGGHGHALLSAERET